MLNGIDVSSWQAGIDIAKLKNCDFVIAKATEGKSYTNPDFARVIKQCQDHNKLFGFYHYMKANNPIEEAKFFYEKTKHLIGKGIPVLDWEENQTVNDVNEFVYWLHEKTGVWAWIYANPWRFNQGGVEQNCGRWIAAYPTSKVVTFDYDPGNIPITEGLVCCWQYSSNGKVDGYNGSLDINHFYGNKEAWLKYANVIKDEPPSLDSKTVTFENDDITVTVTYK